MVEEQGLTDTRNARTTRTLAQTSYRELAAELPMELSAHLAEHRSLETRTYQFVMRVEPLTAATRLLRAEEQAAQDRAERDELIRELAANLVELREQHADDLAKLQAGTERAVGEAHEQERARVERLERKLAMVYDSETWKAGRALLWLPKKLRGTSRAKRDE
jgi:hypothetical protein